MHRRALAALLTVAVALLAGCRSETVTGVRFDDKGAAKVTVSLTLTGEVRDVVAKDPATFGRIDKLVRASFPSARSERKGGQLRWFANATPEQVTAASELTGVSALHISAGRKPRLLASLVRPAKVLSAIEGTEDRAAVPALMENTLVGLSVRFPGPVGEVKAGEVPVRRSGDGRAVSVVQPLSTLVPGDVTVAGSLTPEFPIAGLTIALVLMAATMVLAVTLDRRPRRDGTPR